MIKSNSTREVFIIHLWRLPVNDETWRGKIQNVRTGRSISVAQLNELESLIRRCLNEEKETRQRQAGGLK